jgi:hypothetical protein
MNRRLYVANAILWAAAIVVSALVGAKPILTTVLLPSLAASALVVGRPAARPTPCAE